MRPKFIEELKKNNYPTIPHMLKILRDADIDEGMLCSCSERTYADDGALFVNLPPITESELMHFVLGGFGYVQLIAPANLRASVISLAQEVIAANEK